MAPNCRFFLSGVLVPFYYRAHRFSHHAFAGVKHLAGMKAPMSSGIRGWIVMSNVHLCLAGNLILHQHCVRWHWQANIKQNHEQSSLAPSRNRNKQHNNCTSTDIKLSQTELANNTRAVMKKPTSKIRRSDVSPLPTEPTANRVQKTHRVQSDRKERLR